MKRLLAKIILWFLGRGLEAAAKLDPVVKKEINSWKDSSVIIISINDFGPTLGLIKEKDRLKAVKVKELKNPELAIYFKNIEAALLVLTGQTGIARAFSEHRFSVRGDIGFSMSFVRVLYIVESYLFPKFITNKILKQQPKKGSTRFRIYLSVLFGI